MDAKQLLSKFYQELDAVIESGQFDDPDRDGAVFTRHRAVCSTLDAWLYARLIESKRGGATDDDYERLRGVQNEHDALLKQRFGDWHVYPFNHELGAVYSYDSSARANASMLREFLGSSMYENERRVAWVREQAPR